MATLNLLSCPFCGKSVKIRHDQEKRIVQILCMCGPWVTVTRHYGPQLRYKTYEQARDAAIIIWNKRAPVKEHETDIGGFPHQTRLSLKLNEQLKDGEFDE